MESGYTRKKVPTPEQKEALLERKRAGGAERQRAYRERKAKGEVVPGQRPGREPGSLNMATREMLAKAKGKPLAREILEEAMVRTLHVARRWYPLDVDGSERFHMVPGKDEQGNPIERRVATGNHERFMEAMEATARFAAWLAPFQSPKLSAIAVAQPQSSKTEHVVMEINVFGDRGEHMARVIDGRSVALPPPRKVVTHDEGGQDGQ